MSALSEYLRALLRQSGLGQNEFAEAAGTTPGTMSKWLRGTHAPDIEQLVTLSDSLEDNLHIDAPLELLIELRIGRPVIPSGDASERARRIAAQADAIPDFAELAEGFLGLEPHEQDAVLSYQELLRNRRAGRRGRGR